MPRVHHGTVQRRGRSGGARRRRHRTTAIAAACVGLLLAAASSTLAQPTGGDDPPAGLVVVDPEFEEAAPFRDGHWTGSLTAAGPVSASFDDATITMHTSMSGLFDVVVVQDEVAGGTWNLAGSSFGSVVTGFGTGMIRNRYQGVGPVGGDQDALTLGGGIDTTWEISFGGPTDVSQDPQRLGPFEVVVTHADCRRLIGRWESAFAAEIAQAGGWESQLSGSFQATHTDEPPDAALLEEIERFGDDYNRWVADVREGVYADLEAGSATSVADTALDPVADLIERSYDLELRLGALADDEACLFGQDLGAFSFLLTAALQDLVWWLLAVVDDLETDTLELLARGLLAVGGIGDGAIRPERAAQLEQRFADRAGEALERTLFDDQPPDCTPDRPCFPDEPDVVSLVVLLVQLGLTVEVAGVTITPERLADALAEREDV